MRIEIQPDPLCNTDTDALPAALMIRRVLAMENCLSLRSNRISVTSSESAECGMASRLATSEGGANH